MNRIPRYGILMLLVFSIFVFVIIFSGINGFEVPVEKNDDWKPYRVKEKAHLEFVTRLKEMNVIKTDLTFESFLKVDRADFCPMCILPYQDHPHQIGHGATISAPHMHAYAVDNFNDILLKNDRQIRILDVGSGSGFLVAVFAHIVCPFGGNVFGLELIPELVDQSLENLKKNEEVSKWIEEGCIRIEKGNAWDDNIIQIPQKDDTVKEEEEDSEDSFFFDIIHVGAAADGVVPPSLLRILKTGGRMIIPVGENKYSQYIYIVEKDEEGKITKRREFGVRYVPLKKS